MPNKALVAIRLDLSNAETPPPALAALPSIFSSSPFTSLNLAIAWSAIALISNTAGGRKPAIIYHPQKDA